MIDLSRSLNLITGALFSPDETWRGYQPEAGNWAEHTWVKESLRTAWIQKDINDAVAHNYALYQEYEDDLKQYVAR